MKALTLLLLPLVLTACPQGREYPYPEAPATLDYGPHPAALGTLVTITGPANPYTKVGAGLYINQTLTGESYGEMLPNRQARLRLPATPPKGSRTGPILAYPSEISSIFAARNCTVNTITASNNAIYSIPSFYTAYSASYSGQVTAQFTPVRNYTSVLPALLARGMVGFVTTGHLVHVNQDVTLVGEMECGFQNPSDYTLKINVDLKAGWNVLREQVLQPGGMVENYAVTGSAADYTVEP